MGLFGAGPGGTVTKGVMTSAAAQGATDVARQNEMYGKSMPFLSSLVATQPGQMSPYAKAQYGSTLRDIGRNYQNSMQEGLKAAAYRGRGGPGGAVSSLQNAALQAKQGADTEAYNRGMQTTLGAGLEGTQQMQGLQSIYDPNRAWGTATNAAQAYDQMRSAGIGRGFGLIGAGLSAIPK